MKKKEGGQQKKELVDLSMHHNHIFDMTTVAGGSSSIEEPLLPRGQLTEGGRLTTAKNKKKGSTANSRKPSHFQPRKLLYQSLQLLFTLAKSSTYQEIVQSYNSEKTGEFGLRSLFAAASGLPQNLAQLKQQLSLNRTEEIIALERSFLIPAEGGSRPAKRGHGDDDEDTKNSMMLDDYGGSEENSDEEQKQQVLSQEVGFLSV